MGAAEKCVGLYQQESEELMNCSIEKGEDGTKILKYKEPISYEKFVEILDKNARAIDKDLAGKIKSELEYIRQLESAKTERANLEKLHPENDEDLNSAGTNPYVLRAAISVLKEADKTIEGEMKNEFGVMSYVLKAGGKPSETQVDTTAKTIAETHGKNMREKDLVKIGLMLKQAGIAGNIDVQGESIREKVLSHFKGVLDGIDTTTTSIEWDPNEKEDERSKKSLVVQLLAVETSIRNELRRLGQPITEADKKIIRAEAKNILANQFTSAYISNNLIKDREYGISRVKDLMKPDYKLGRTEYENDIDTFKTYIDRQNSAMNANSMFKKEAA